MNLAKIKDQEQQGICGDCGHVGVPSFSEGPKTIDPETERVVRFRKAANVCAKCFSFNVRPLRETL